MSKDRQVFVTEQQESQSELTKQQQLTQYPYDSSLELQDLKLRRMFLKRSEQKAVKLGDLYIGSIVLIHSRQLKIVDQGDVFTAKYFENVKGRTIVVIKPDAYKDLGSVIRMIEINEFRINKLKMIKFDHQTANILLSNEQSQNNLDNATNHLISDSSVILEVIGNDCVNKMQHLAGSLNPNDCAKNTLRGCFGTSIIKNAVYVSTSPILYKSDSSLLFNNNNLYETAQFNNCTACVIKPHVLYSNRLGEIVQIILNEGQEVSAMELFNLDISTSEEFYEVYKGVIPEYRSMVEHLSEGPCVAMEIRQQNAVNSFRELCGPHDPEVAKYLRPSTLRALFGNDRVKNGVHGTDLEEDGILEVEQFFNILQKN